MQHAIKLTAVTKRFADTTAVNDIDLIVEPGCIHGFIGPNGSGKTTTLRIVLGILAADSGTVSVLGSRPGAEVVSRIGYLPEERGLYRKMKTGAAIRFFASLKGASLSNKEIDRLLDDYGVGGCGDKHVEALSKGMAQKVQMIVACAHNPQLLILDEPFSGLDPLAAELIEERIRRQVARGTTVLLSTHDMDAAQRLCSSIFMIHQGRGVLGGTMNEIRETHGKPRLRISAPDFDGDLTRLPGVLSVQETRDGYELETTGEVDPARIAELLTRGGKLRHLEVVRPTLREIFVRIAGPPADGEGADNA